MEIVETEGEMVAASTFIPLDVSVKVNAAAKRDDRKRAYILRKALIEWADKEPTPRKSKASVGGDK